MLMLKASHSIFKVGIPLLAVLGGLVLAAMMPVGFFLGIEGPVFGYMFLSHLAFLVLAFLLSLLFFLKLLAESKWPWFWPVFILVTFAGAILLLCFVPSIDKAVLSHHLFVSKHWVLTGKIAEIAWHEPSYYPMLINLAYTAMLSKGWEIYLSAYHFIYLILLCGVVSCLVLRETKNAEVSVFSFLLPLTTPICIRLASAPLPDLAVALYFTIAVSSLICWSEKKHMSAYAVQAGMALGLTMSCKYAGVLAVIVFIPAFILLRNKASVKAGSALAGLFSMGALALLVFSPWLLRNALWTNDPFFPLFKSFIGISETSIKYAIYPFSFVTERIALNFNGIIDIIIMPIQMIAFGQDGNLNLFDGVLSPLLLLIFFPLVIKPKKEWLGFTMVLLGIYFFLVVVFLRPTVVLMMPILGTAFFLVGYGAHLMSKFFRGKHRLLVSNLLLLVQFGFALLYCFGLYTDRDALAYYYQKETRTHYLKRMSSDYKIIELANKSVSDNELLYLVFMDDHFYYYDRQLASEGKDSWKRLKDLISTVEDAAALKSELRATGIGYILANQKILSHIVSISLTIDQKNIWKEFSEKLLSIEHQEGDFILWKVSEPYVLEKPEEAPDKTDGEKPRSQEY